MDNERNERAARRRLVVLHVMAHNKHKTAFTVEGLNQRMLNQQHRRQLPCRIAAWKLTQLASDLRVMARAGQLEELQVIDTRISKTSNRLLHNRRAYSITDRGRSKLKGVRFY